ncbi:MAG: zf-HC2 domain-containing protein, partial [Myxococcaceae bacterium]
MTPEDHSGGPVHCDQLGRFVDGELAVTEAAAFRRHLIVCARCQQEMHGLMQLSALAEQSQGRAPAARPELAPTLLADRRAPPRRAAWLAVVGAVAMAAALVLALKSSRSTGPDMPTLLASLDARTVSGWPSAAGAAQYRPYRTMRGGPVPIPPALAQAELRLQGSDDWRRLGTLALLRRDFSQAESYLARLPPTPDVLADRGLVRLEEQRYPEALEYFDAALTAAPDFLPARFNRALALQALQLPFAAAAAMGPVAQSTAGGWATEARQDATTFESAKSELRDDDARWKDARRALIERQEAPAAALVTSHWSLARSAFYHALASAPTRADVEKLRPFARELDREIGSGVLESRIDIVLRGWTAARPELAAHYRDLIIDLSVPQASALDGLLAEARRAGQKDILQQLYENYRPYTIVPEREALVRTFKDPWFEATLAARTANAEMDTGRVREAERRVRQARELCRPESMQAPCWYLTETLGDLYRMVGRFADAQREYRTVAPRLKAAGMYPFERKAMLEAARVAVQADQLALARASYEDLSLREPERCLTWVWSRELLASGYVSRREPEAARKVLAVKAQCKGSLDAEPWRARWRLELGQLTGDRSMLEEARTMAASTVGIARTAPREIAAARVLEGIAAMELGAAGAEKALAETIAAEEAS